PRVHAILNTAIRNGASVRAMADQIIQALEGLRSTKGFTDFEQDLAILIYRLGGRSLLYAMNHALNLPYLHTICNSAKFIKIHPTIGPISDEEICAKVKDVVLQPRADAGMKRRGATIMLDEIALEEAAVYFPLTLSFSSK
ncbi:hypothetical protein B0H10DRAFT_2320372, partial [Mycena sp. CBHHK59/15]